MYNVIIVDDEELILEGMKTFIPWADYQMKVVNTFTSCLDALGYIKENRVDLIVTDIKMPEMDGIELIRQVYEDYPEIKTVVLSGYNEFEYAQKALLYGASGYITKPTEEASVRVILNKVKGEIMSTKGNDVPKLENMLRDVVLYNHMKGESERVLKEFLIFDNYYMLVIKENGGWVSPLVLYNLLNDTELSGFLPESSLNYIAIKHKESIIILLALESHSDELSFRKLVNHFQEKIQKSYSQGSIFAVLEGPVNKLDKLNNLYRTAENKLKHTFYFNYRLADANVRRHIRQAAVSDTRLLEDSINYEEFINSVLFADKDEKVKAAIEKFIDSVKGIFLEDSVIEKIPEIITNKFLAIIENGNKSEISDIPGNNKVRSFNELKDRLTEIITTLKMKYLDNYSSHEQVIVKAIKRFIEKNYKENISLEQAAQHVNISVYYLCHIFKEITGFSFLQYLINYRLEKAKVLIENTDLHINEVTEMVGYSDSRHFIKHFKRHFGVSPSKIKRI